MTLLEQLETKVLLERLVIGLEEPILVKGLGELQAKIDSGNGGYNVIHGTDFHQQGNELMFTTHDSFGHEKKIQAKIIDTIEVNMGGGNIENRPVIELDIKFAGEDYRKIPFSVSDRSSNTHPILISKGFVENELEALIDVGAKNISNDGIDVVYGESFWKPTTEDSPTLKAIKGVSDRYNGFLNKISNVGKLLGGDMTIGDYLDGVNKKDNSEPKSGSGSGSGLSKKDKSISKKISNSQETQQEDKEEITPKINSLTIPKKITKDPQADLSNTIIEKWVKGKLKNALPICLVTSHMMCKGNAQDKKTVKGLEQDKNAIKDWVHSTKEKVKLEKKLRRGSNEEEEETTNTTPQEATPQTPANPAEQNTNQPDPTPENNQPNDNFEEVTTFFEELCQFTLWFVSIEKISNPSKYEKNFNKYIQSGQFDDILYKMFKSGTISPSTIAPYVEKLAQLFQKDGKQGFFILRWTPISQSELKDEMKDVKRQTHFYEDLKFVSYAKKSTQSNTPQFDKAEAELTPKPDTVDETPQEDVTTDEGEVEGQTDDVESEQTDTVDETPQEDVTTDEGNVENPPTTEDAPTPETQIVDEPPATQTDETPQPQEQVSTLEDPPITQETDTQPDVITKPQEETPAPEPQIKETEPEKVEEPSPTPKFDEAEKQILKNQETESQPEPKNQTKPELKVKSRAQMNAHARANRKAHMKKGKKKGTESEEEPQEDDLWIKDKLDLLRQKGLI